MRTLASVMCAAAVALGVLGMAGVLDAPWEWGIPAVVLLVTAVLLWKVGGVLRAMPAPPSFGHGIRSFSRAMEDAQAAMASTTQMLHDMSGNSDRARHLRDSGLDGRVTISAVRDTHGEVNLDPIIELDLLVWVADRPPHVAHRREVVSRLVLHRLTPGAAFAARIDPANPDVFMADWSSPLL